MSDRVLVMREGELVAEFARHEFADDSTPDTANTAVNNAQPADTQAERLKHTQERIATAMMRASNQSEAREVTA